MTQEKSERATMLGKKPKGVGHAKSFAHSKFHEKIETKNPHLKGKYTQTEYRAAIRAFWDKVGDIMLNQPNGVVLDGLGYFAFPSYTRRVKDPRTKQTTFRRDGLIYYPQFFGYMFKNFYVGGLSLELSCKYSKKLYHLLIAGATYKFHYYHVKTMIGDRTKYKYTPKRISS